MKSTMFLSNITAVDHAYIDNRGHVIGGSVNPTMLVSGNIDTTENVVIDFSSVKKSIKEIIDAKYSGFDHKLWIIEGYSRCTVVNQGLPNITIETPVLSIEAPRDAFKFIAQTEFFQTSYKDAVIRQMEHELNVGLNLLYPGVNITVEVNFEEAFWGNTMMDTPMIPFRYVHGLKASTSWGCQNIAHGHLSYLAASTDHPMEAEIVLQKIAADIDNTIFVWGENIKSVDDFHTFVEYFTGRGVFKMTISHDLNVIALKTETTVEFLAEAIASEYGDMLKAAGVSRLFVSEGLNKGAVVEI